MALGRLRSYLLDDAWALHARRPDHLVAAMLWAKRRKNDEHGEVQNAFIFFVIKRSPGLPRTKPLAAPSPNRLSLALCPWCSRCPRAPGNPFTIGVPNVRPCARPRA
ncbi:hypothetical protein NDU88_002713 [Pleurodeles waltl]|uniref:Uncharacterized protein n=1 Tax=Pleurodeles waltl TaxID=8319 RepID=A0AAV7TNW5_PLEWA|nr:hypothetical protein NDU88_002713 [Pleurodeles waltl]